MKISIFKLWSKRPLFTSILSLLLFPSALVFAGDNWNTELQWNLCEDNEESVVTALRGLNEEKSSRRIYYYETANFDFYQNGVVIRKRANSKGTDLTVKIKLSSTTEIKNKWRDLDGFKCEFDAHGTKKTFTCSLKEKEVDLTKKQKEFIEEFKPKLLALLDQTKRTNAIENRVYEFDSEAGALVMEGSSIGGKNFLELSQRVKSEDASSAKRAIENLLQNSHIRLCENQESTTLEKMKAAFAK